MLKAAGSQRESPGGEHRFAPSRPVLGHGQRPNEMAAITDKVQVPVLTVLDEQHTVDSHP
jgi:hypothetical protein